MQKDGFLVSAYGVRMPGIVYGTAWKKDRTAALVEQAVSLGFRGIDTACQPKHYDEPGVGAGLAACMNAGLERADLYLQSKFTPVDGQDPERMPYDPKASLAEQVARSFESSLKNLRTSYLDCLILHSPLSKEKDTLDVWRAMETVFDGGGARQLGISNCYRPELLERLYRWSRVKPAVVQNRFYAETRYDHEIREFCRQNRIVYQSFWTLTANPSILAHATLRALAATHGRTPAQVFFRYLTQIGVVPLTGTASEAHMREDLAIFEFELTPDQCAAVSGLLST
ncbi:aldo/keto reductase family protein [Methylococcus capsulatus]|jgi:diketogulonate reductase-like aldo/keto reductase|uniref:Oxidoreductase, aldo/keto reductase family n=1 Tax=Methylococcus capsulatus TaxID=414 RepID=A0AA35UNT1_METCP|nr:aldo/keto reductase [Methylococcus capsulatus]CAI8763403.1 Oxidoreductase, aldo/keto reductase family [Methylococcus capsulatus]